MKEIGGNRGQMMALLASSALLAACAGEMPEEELVASLSEAPPDESRCGPLWDVQPVEQYNGALGVSRAFVTEHERRVGYHVDVGCTGTLISDDLFLSAGHCEYLVNDTVRFDFQVDASGAPRPARDFPVIEVVEQEESAAFDYAIVRLGGDPGREYGHAAIAAVDPPAGSTVAIIQHPERAPKGIHAGPVVDYSSGRGTNWFRHQVDTEGGSSGSGVLDAAGQLVGVHTHAGCATADPIDGNSAMRMSQLVPHSPTLQALVRSHILWTDGSGRISLWTVNPDNVGFTFVQHGPFPGWTAIGMADNRILWKDTTGKISLWRMDRNGNRLSFTQHGPFPGWTPVNYANDRILWRHETGRISLWVLDDSGNRLSFVEHGPFPGWTPVNYANDRILWRHDSGRISVWVVDAAGNRLSFVEHGPFPGWTPIQLDGSDILWRHEDGRISMWQLDRTGGLAAFVQSGPFAGWTAIAGADRRILWTNASGRISYWTVNGDGALMSFAQHGPFTGWTPRFTTGGEP